MPQHWLSISASTAIKHVFLFGQITYIFVKILCILKVFSEYIYIKKRKRKKRCGYKGTAEVSALEEVEEEGESTSLLALLSRGHPGSTWVLAWCLEQRWKVRDTERQGKQWPSPNVRCIYLKDCIAINTTLTVAHQHTHTCTQRL